MPNVDFVQYNIANFIILEGNSYENTVSIVCTMSATIGRLHDTSW